MTLRQAFGNLSDAALAGLAGATDEQRERIEQFILRECYPMHYPSEPAAILARQAIDATAEPCEDTVLGTGAPETLTTVAGTSVDLRKPWGWGGSGVVTGGGYGAAIDPTVVKT